MNKSELIVLLAKDLGVNKAQIEKWLDSLHGIIFSHLKKGEKVVLPGFGTFLVSFRKARRGRNPRTGEVIGLKALKAPHFRCGKEFKKSVNR